MKDISLFALHDAVNILVFLFVFSLFFVDTSLHGVSYQLGKFLHLLGLLWFFGGLIMSSFCLSRLVWSQPALTHENIAFGYRVILLLELLCIPSIALMAYAGMAMINQMGGLGAHRWAFQGYIFLLASPPILLAIPRFYHKRLIKDGSLNLEKERRKAMWQDWFFIVLMAMIIGMISASMVFKSPIM